MGEEGSKGLENGEYSLLLIFRGFSVDRGSGRKEVFFMDVVLLYLLGIDKII